MTIKVFQFGFTMDWYSTRIEGKKCDFRALNCQNLSGLWELGHFVECAYVEPVVETIFQEVRYPN